VSDRYLGWLNNEEVRSIITAAKRTSTITSLREYVRIQSALPDTLFLGIFGKDNNLHVGNIKYQPADSQKKLCGHVNSDRRSCLSWIRGGIRSHQGKCHLAEKASKYQPNRSWSTQKE
jgi:hypothetical protein